MPSLPKNAQIWLPGYLKSAWEAHRRWQSDAPQRVWVVIADHFEPFWAKPDRETAYRRVAEWCQAWPEIAGRHFDDANRPPQYSFFYPEEEYEPPLLESIAGMTRAGLGDVEIHIHHDRDSEHGFVERMGRFLEVLEREHGLLRRVDGKLRFGFIHGNWALDNSRPDGRWCGLNNELILLRDLGCYADFTLPSAPEATQTRTVNQIYWATDNPSKPKSHEYGKPLRPGGGVDGDLLIVPGPLAVSWGDRGRRAPRLETGELAGNYAPTPKRIRLWLDYAPRIGGDVFVKLFTHGTQERNSRLLLHGGLDNCFAFLREETQKLGAKLYYVTAWQMWQAIEALRLQRNPLEMFSAAR